MGLLEDYKKYNRLGGIASAVGEIGGIIANVDNKNRTKTSYDPLKKISPEQINLKSPDVATPGRKNIEKAYATGLKTLRESGRGISDYEGMLGQTITALQTLQSQQAAIDVETAGKNQMFNAEARLKAEMFNVEVEKANEDAKFQRDQFQFQTDSLYNTNIQKGIARTTDILTSIPIKDLMAEIEIKKNDAYIKSLMPPVFEEEKSDKEKTSNANTETKTRGVIFVASDIYPELKGTKYANMSIEEYDALMNSRNF
jgi:hypothetical protein